MELHNRIKHLRIKSNMSQKELGQKIGFSVVSIGSWENGTKLPSANAIVLLAEFFGVSTDYLFGVDKAVCAKDDLLLSKKEKTLLKTYRSLDSYGKDVVDSVCELERKRVEENYKSKDDSGIMNIAPQRYIPLYLSSSAAGKSVPIDTSDYELIPMTEDVPPNADFAVVINGNSMAPYINDGDIVYVERDCELSIGDVGIFSVDGAMYCKQYYLDDENNLVLVSANPALKHTNVFVSADSNSYVKCYGKVLLNRKIPVGY